MPDTSTNKTLSELTNRIVKERTLQSKKFIEYKERLLHIESVLTSIRPFRNDNVWAISSDNGDINGHDCVINTSSAISLWNDISTSTDNLLKSINQALNGGYFSSAYARATRKFVNVGSIGIKREGKSTLVRTVTSCDEWLVPTRDGDNPCTTAPINIINTDNHKPSSDSHDDLNLPNETVRVYFYTIPEMVKYLNQYIEELGDTTGKYKLPESEIKTISEFKNECKSLLNRAKDDGQFGHGKISSRTAFMKYLQHVDKYADRLVEIKDTENGPVPNGRTYTDYAISDINKHGDKAKAYYSSVSYYETPGARDEVYTSFATKLAEVYTSFKIGNEPVANIQFMDTPGIGENKSGIERTLSDAITMLLDVVIVVKAVGNSKSDKDSDDFYTLLRERLDKRDTAQHWVYYILNVWRDNINEGDISKAKEAIVNNLTVAQMSSKIELADSHFKYMDLKAGCELDENGGDINYEQPVSRYLRDILDQLIPNISAIDAEFFKEGEKEYNEIMQQWKTLFNDMRSLTKYLPDTSNVHLVNQTIETIGTELTKIATWDGFLRKEINPNLSSFKDSILGTYVLKLLEYDINEKDKSILSEVKFAESDEDDDIDSCGLSQSRILTFVKEYSTRISQYMLMETAWRENMGFTIYTGSKAKLQSFMVDDIQELIDDKSAKNKLSEFKRSIAKVFMDYGKLTFVSSNPTGIVTEDSWWEDMLAYLQEEQGCSAFEKIIQDVKELEIDVKGELEGCIKKSIAESLHYDNFGNEYEYSFQNYESAICSYIHSLLNIETTAKRRIEERVMNEALKKLEDNITSVLSRVIDLCKNADNVFGVTDTKAELQAFYHRHLDEVLKGDAQAKKSSLVSKWKNIINQENGHNNG